MTGKNKRESFSDAGEKIRSGELMPSSALEVFLKRISSRDGEIKSFVLYDAEKARRRAEELDAKIKSGRKPGRLCGCVVAIKDNINIKGEPTTCGSKILAGYKSPYDASVVESLHAEDAVIVGKTNLDEFAMGSSTENSAHFPTRNPWDVSRVPGGSSGGSAAAVAAGFAHAALGSDTGGSIRQPAAFCGVVGVKPTYGAVSRYGLVAFASSLDQIGPFAQNVDDAALILSVIAGRDARDATSSYKKLEGLAPLGGLDLKGVRVGLPSEYFIEGAVSGEITEAIEKVTAAMSARGAEIKKISLPHAPYGVATYYVIAPSEASSNLARFDGVKYGLSVDALGLVDLYKETREAGFGPEVKRRIMLGTYSLSSGYYDAYYSAAQKVRALIKEDFRRAFAQADFLISPTTTTTAFKIGEKISDPLGMYLSDVFTISANLAGIPAMSLPVAVGASSRLPVGMQIMAPHFCDSRMLSFAKTVEDFVKFEPLV